MTLTGKLVLAAAAVVALSGSAMAADLTYSAPPAQPAFAPAPAQSDWDGPYIGATLGYGWGTADDTSATDSTSLSGWSLGGQVGYNFHLGDTVVAGVEGNLDWSNESGSFSGTSPLDTYRVNWDGSVRGRLGVDLDGILPYAEAGIAFANATGNDGTTDFNGTYTGWTAGAGIEFKVSDQVSTNVEYRYTDYGTQTIDSDTVHLTDNALRVGLNYHF